MRPKEIQEKLGIDSKDVFELFRWKMLITK